MVIFHVHERSVRIGLAIIIPSLKTGSMSIVECLALQKTPEPFQVFPVTAFLFPPFHGQKQYAVLRRPVPETDRSPETPVSLWFPSPGNFVCIPGSKTKRPPVSSETFWLPISLQIFSRRKYICLHKSPVLSHQ